ncbi:LysE family transporter [Alphaproteobacteria bacterium]|jgi:threonine/homoserine/homoserine lactone efflux protein|nr:LysE family transporter [Alphaproteobacteria bacterium]
MEIQAFLAFNLLLLAAMLSPGPAFLFIVSTSLRDGRAAGISAGIGLGFIAAFWTLAAVLGLDAVLALVPGLYSAIKIGGALFLVWIAIGLWRDQSDTKMSDTNMSDTNMGDANAIEESEESEEFDGTSSKNSTTKSFIAGFLSPMAFTNGPLVKGILINLFNPKPVIFSASVIVVIFPRGVDLSQMILIPLNQLVVEIVMYALFAFVFSRPAVRRSYFAGRRWVNRIAAVIMGGLGIRLLTE